MEWNEMLSTAFFMDHAAIFSAIDKENDAMMTYRPSKNMRTHEIKSKVEWCKEVEMRREGTKWASNNKTHRHTQI